MDADEPGRTSLSRRTLLTAGGLLAVAGATGLDLSNPVAAFAATIGDPWAERIRSWNWNWALHRAHGYSGGQDYDFAYGAPFYAPAAGTLSVQGGSDGQSTLTLDSTVSRVLAAEPGESGDTLAKLVFLHQSAFGGSGHYSAGSGPIGWVGNTGVSAAHLHVHGISTTGGRVDWRKFVSGSSTGGDNMPTLINQAREIPQPTTLPVISWTDLEAGTPWPTRPSSAYESILAYNSGTATNPAELVPSATKFQWSVTLYVSNLPAGEIVGVRMGIQNKSTGAISGLATATFGDANALQARGQYNAQMSIDQSTSRAVVQAFSSIAGVSVDKLVVNGFAW